MRFVVKVAKVVGSGGFILSMSMGVSSLVTWAGAVHPLVPS